MSKNVLRVLMFLVALVIGIALISGCAGGPGQHSGPTAPPTPTHEVELSEQPDQATFNQYFSDMRLGKLLAGQQLSLGHQPQPAIVFTPDVQLCLLGTVIQEVQPSLAIYDTVTKEFISPKTPLPRTLQQGGFASCGGTPQVGKYEYKVYVSEVLVAVLPFEVVEQLSEETPTEVSQPELEVWITKGEDYQAKFAVMTSEETKDARVWVKGPEGATISFQIWFTFPGGNRVPYVDDGRTDPAGKPVRCGGFAQALSKGIYEFEVVIDDTVVGSTTLEVTD